jgi:hypothetical protein
MGKENEFKRLPYYKLEQQLDNLNNLKQNVFK